MTVNGHSFDWFIHESMTSCLGVSKKPKAPIIRLQKKRCDSLKSSGVALVLFLVLKKSSCSNTQYRNVPGQKSGKRPAKRWKIFTQTSIVGGETSITELSLRNKAKFLYWRSFVNKSLWNTKIVQGMFFSTGKSFFRSTYSCIN